MPDSDSNDITRSHVQLAHGSIIGHYRIIERIGAGGMGEVYLAEDTELNRKVALKFLPSHLCQDADCRARFTREAQASAKLDHPNIVAVHEVGEYNGRPFFSMQHVEGQTLKEVIAGKTLPLDRILGFAIQVCEGLQVAHDKGITHRDIKPSNILIDSHGRARIVDFGLASVTGLDHLTKTGSTLGTIGYMSPEQVRGDKVDHRTDLFSFGVVLYEMITGQSPFKCDTEAATLNAITTMKPELLARFRREVPPELQTIIDKALDKKATTRYQHADDLQADLERLKETLSRVRATRKVSSRKALWLGLAGAFAVLAAGVVLLLVRPWSPAPIKPSGKIMLAVLPFENLGNAEDEYFADGITDEITGTLAAMKELGVISRTSTILYKHTTKDLRQIAKELGVDYILEGTILCERGRDSNRIRVIPQLIRASDDTHLWSEVFQRPLTDIFSVQAEIAARIAGIMNIAVRESQNSTFKDLPTTDFEAYCTYLKSFQSVPELTYRDWLERSQRTLERAVTLDSTFAQAYAKLSSTHSQIYLYGYDVSTARQVLCKNAVDKAFALQPDLPDVHMAYSNYYYRCKRDYNNALRELAIAESGLPNNAAIPERRGYIFRRQGDFVGALESLKNSLLLDPRSADKAGQVGLTYLILRDYDSALAFTNRCIALNPADADAYLQAATVYIDWRGDTAAARASLISIPGQKSDDVRIACYDFNVLVRDYDVALCNLDSLEASIFWGQESVDTKSGLRGFVLALKGDSSSARACYDSARIILEGELKDKPDDHRIRSSLGLVYAALGRKEEAIQSGKLAVELCPEKRDALIFRRKLETLAAIYVTVGEYDLAMDQVEYLLSVPSYLSASRLRLAPICDPLRNLPRFRQILEKYGT
jgi:serine/threonine protein kinase/tetratricopeptide (TPR) repeat protein